MGIKDTIELKMCTELTENMTQSDTESDVFADLYDKGSFKIVCVTIATILLILTSAAAFGIIWFERFASDKKRTLVNMMVSASCWTLIEFRWKTYFNFCLYINNISWLSKYYCLNYWHPSCNKGTSGFTSNTINLANMKGIR